MSLIKEAIQEIKNMEFPEIVCFIFLILVVVGTLVALIGSSGPLVPVVEYVNYQQSRFFQSVFGGEPRYYGKITIIIIGAIGTIPYLIAKFSKRNLK